MSDQRLRQRLAKRLRVLRRSQSLSVPALAARADLSARCVYAIEAGATNPRWLTLMRLATGLNVSMPILFAGVPAGAVSDIADGAPPTWRLDQVFVIHRETGLVLHHVTFGGRPLKDPDVIGGMLAAIQDVVRDSFRGCRQERLMHLAVAQRLSLVLGHGGQTTVVAVIRRPARCVPRSWTEGASVPVMELDALQARLQALADHLDRTYGAALRAFQGDLSPFRPLAAVVRAVLRADRAMRLEPAA